MSKRDALPLGGPESKKLKTEEESPGPSDQMCPEAGPSESSIQEAESTLEPCSSTQTSGAVPPDQMSPKGGIFRSFIIERKWNPVRGEAFEGPPNSSVFREQSTVTYITDCRQRASLEAGSSKPKFETPSNVVPPEWNARQIVCSEPGPSNFSLPSNQTFRSYTIERPWNPRMRDALEPDSTNDSPQRMQRAQSATPSPWIRRPLASSTPTGPALHGRMGFHHLYLRRMALNQSEPEDMELSDGDENNNED